jgi:hypothetical protein
MNVFVRDVPGDGFHRPRVIDAGSEGKDLPCLFHGLLADEIGQLLLVRFSPGFLSEFFFKTSFLFIRDHLLVFLRPQPEGHKKSKEGDLGRETGQGKKRKPVRGATRRSSTVMDRYTKTSFLEH